MSKTLNAFLCGTALISLGLLVTACPHKQTVKTVPTQSTAETKPPDIAIPTNTTPPTETVAPRKDFVAETPIKEETLPKEIEQLNQYVQSKGYIQDAFYDFDAATLPSQAQVALTASATWLKAHPDYNLLGARLPGHARRRRDAHAHRQLRRRAAVRSGP